MKPEPSPRSEINFLTSSANSSGLAKCDINEHRKDVSRQLISHGHGKQIIRPKFGQFLTSFRP